MKMRRSPIDSVSDAFLFQRLWGSRGNKMPAVHVDSWGGSVDVITVSFDSVQDPIVSLDSLELHGVLP